MARRGYPRRYAQAVFEIARERKELAGWQSDLEKIASLVEDAALIAWLESPKFLFEDKVKLLAQRLGDVNPLALNLAYLLVARGKLDIATDIAAEYQRLWDSYQGIEPAEVITAMPLDDEDKQRLSERLGRLINKKVMLEAKVDSGIIGGIVARLGGKLLDGSTRSRLLALKREMGG
ncbi:ATP synthase F1 subunit delta [Chloroflexota bacterium]